MLRKLSIVFKKIYQQIQNNLYGDRTGYLIHCFQRLRCKKAGAVLEILLAWNKSKSMRCEIFLYVFSHCILELLQDY